MSENESLSAGTIPSSRRPLNVRYFRPKGFAITEGLPEPEPGRLLPYKEDSEALHKAITEGEGASFFGQLEPDAQAALLWAADIFLAVAVDNDAERSLAIAVVVESLGNIASIIPLEAARG
jgi:hypothetical protein